MRTDKLEHLLTGGTKLFLIVVLIAALALTVQNPAVAAETWTQVANEVKSHLEEAIDAYRGGKPAEAKKHIDAGYFGPFESDGMEAAIRDYISSARAFEIEQEFKQMKMAVAASKSPAEVEQLGEKIAAMLEQDAAALDGGSTGSSASTPFLQSFLIIVREGFEAILIISALVAYLVRSGRRDKVSVVYAGGALALLASAATAAVIQAVFSGASSAGREFLEGATMLLAVAVLFWVSFWLTGKAQAQKWQEYIEGKVKSSLGKGSLVALAAAAFLAVYREGAETILFYSALLSGDKPASSQIAAGFIVGSLVLVGLFLLLGFGSVRIPIKPFFIATSVLLYYLAFTFAGKGIHELQEAGAIGSLRIPGAPVVEPLGIYPTVQTLSLQALLLALAAGGFAWQLVSSKRSKRAAARNAA